jgi:hypothetical protein
VASNLTMPVRAAAIVAVIFLVAGSEGSSAIAEITTYPLRSTIRRHRNRIRHCYERALLREPSLRGTVVVGWVIEGDGRVRDVEVVRGLDGRLDRCLADVHREIVFPARGRDEAPVRVIYPYRFRRRR